MPWWAAVIVVWASGRFVTTVFLMFYAANQAENPWTTSSPSLFDFSSLWDGRWYNIIAVSGYPSQLPLTDDGHVGENQWAFLPVFPSLSRLLMNFGFDWNTAGIAVSLAAGLGASIYLFRLIAVFAPPSQALFTVTLFSVAPTSPMLQLAYAESLQMLLVAASLYYLTQHRYGMVLFLGTVLAFTRPGALALALTVLLHAVVRFAHRSSTPFPTRERVTVLLTAVWLALAGLAWPVIAGLVTGTPSAYFDTELAWRSSYIGHVELVPFTPWILGAQWWAQTQWNIPELWAYVALGGVIAIGIMLLLLPAARRLGTDIRLWCLSYGLYLLAVFFPQSSTFRILAPLFPGLGILAAPQSRVYRLSLVGVFLVAQFLWIGAAWAVSDYDWTPP
jgi:hypothetical protein